MCPGFIRYLPLRFATTPVSIRWLGEGKTCGAYYAGPCGAILMLGVQQLFPQMNAEFGLYDYYGPEAMLYIAPTLGLGAILGDHSKSFIKRLKYIKSGARWWPWDAIDFVLGATVATMPVVGWIGLERFAIMIIFMLYAHSIGNEFSYYWSLRKTPW